MAFEDTDDSCAAGEISDYESVITTLKGFLRSAPWQSVTTIAREAGLVPTAKMCLFALRTERVATGCER